MKIYKEKNEMGSYDLAFKEGEKTLNVFYGGNLDLYLSLSNGRLIPDNEDTSITFDITKENYELYCIFDELYNDVIDGKPFGKKSEVRIDYKNRYEYNKLVDKDKNITWISDDGPDECEDRFKLFKYDEDTYRLVFYRNTLELPYGIKNSTAISVRIRNSGSKYDFFHCNFMTMYQKIQEIDPEYHQVHFEEVNYVKKLEKKRQLVYYE